MIWWRKKCEAKDHVSKESKCPIPRIGIWWEIWRERMHENGRMVERLAYGGRGGMCSSKACINLFLFHLHSTLGASSGHITLTYISSMLPSTVHILLPSLILTILFLPSTHAYFPYPLRIIHPLSYIHP